MDGIILNIGSYKVEPLEDDKLLIYQGIEVVGFCRHDIAYVATERPAPDLSTKYGCYVTRAPSVVVLKHSGAKLAFVIRTELVQPGGREIAYSPENYPEHLNKDTNVFEGFPGTVDEASNLVRTITKYILPLKK